MRLFADHYLSRVASLGSPGIDEMRCPDADARKTIFRLSLGCN